MVKLLFIAYYFPPTGGGGVQRSLKFAKYLPDFGIEPIVLTTEHETQTRWILKDENLLNQLDQNLKVYRTPPLRCLTSSPDKLKKLKELLCLTGRFEKEWKQKAIELGRTICKRESPDAIYVSMSPFSGCDIARTLSSEFSIPWTADLRDPWALDEMAVYPSQLHRKFWMRKMKKALSTASSIVMNTPVAASKAASLIPSAKNIFSITNGFDKDDFISDRKTIKKTFTITHTGSLHTQLASDIHSSDRLNRILGRTTLGLNLKTRSHLYLIKALEKIQERAPTKAKQIRVQLIGPTTELDRKVVSDSHVSQLVEMTPFLPHKETTREQMSSNLLFLPMQDINAGERTTIVPGKTYEYLACGVPILGAVPDGDTKDFLNNSGMGLTCRPSDIDSLSKTIEIAFDAWICNERICNRNEDFIKHFERRALTEKLSEVIHSTLNKNENRSS